MLSLSVLLWSCHYGYQQVKRSKILEREKGSEKNGKTNWGFERAVLQPNLVWSRGKKMTYLHLCA